jgi:D-3-phosphoglycerate dehydrogenase / 2-oxoglutarate reductase
MKAVTILGAVHPDAMVLLAERPDVSVTVIAAAHAPKDEVAAAIRGANGIAVRTHRLDAELLASAPGLEIVSRHGVGCDSVDVEWMSARGLPVAIAVGANDRSVAEHTMGMILTLSRDLMRQTEALRRADWTVRETQRAFDLAGKTLLVVGYGRIGRRVAALAQAFGMQVVARDPYVSDFAPGVLIAGTLEEGLAVADVVTVHTPLNGETRHLIGERAVASMKPGALLVNCARGGIVEEAAVARALHSRRLAGYGADVFDVEPVEPTNPIIGAPNVVLSPHTAASTPEGMRAMGLQTIRNVLDCFEGRLKPEMIFNRRELGL